MHHENHECLGATGGGANNHCLRLSPFEASMLVYARGRWKTAQCVLSLSRAGSRSSSSIAAIRPCTPSMKSALECGWIKMTAVQFVAPRSCRYSVICTYHIVFFLPIFPKSVKNPNPLTQVFKFFFSRFRFSTQTVNIGSLRIQIRL